MAEGFNTPPLTQLEFQPQDFDVAHRIAAKLGYKQCPYTSTSHLWGLFCMPENPEHSAGPRHGGVIIKTKELGFLFLQDCSDLGLTDDGRPQ